MIKAIDTKYKNYLFRSRLEARFGVFFDEMGINWLYEHEGFELGVNDRYLPDFYFPDYDLYAEIKPQKFSFKEHSKCRRLALMTNCSVVELVGLPSLDLMNVIIPSLHYICPLYGQEWVYKDPRSLTCRCGAKHRVFKTVNEAQGMLLFDKYKPITYDKQAVPSGKFKRAIIKSTEARFEFNNKNR